MPSKDLNIKLTTESDVKGLKDLRKEFRENQDVIVKQIQELGRLEKAGKGNSTQYQKLASLININKTVQRELGSAIREVTKESKGLGQQQEKLAAAIKKAEKESKALEQQQKKNEQQAKKMFGQSVELGSKQHIAGLRQIRNTLSPLSPQYAQLTARIKQYDSALRKANGTNKMSIHQLLEMGENITVVAAGFYMASGRILQFVKSSIDAFAQQELAVAKLRNGLKNLGDENYLDKLIKQSQELQGKTFFGDEQINNAQAMLATFKLSGAEIELLTPGLLDLATSLEQTGQGTADLQSLAIQLGKVAGTELTSSLTRMGVVMSSTQSTQLRLASGMEKTIILAQILDDNFKGLAETTAGTTAQEMKAFENAIGDIKESIGEGVVNSLTHQMKTLGVETQSTTGKLSKTEEVVKAITFVMSGGLGVISTWGFAIKTIKDEVNLLSRKMDDAKRGVAGLLTAMQMTPSTNLFSSMVSQVVGFQKEILIAIGLLDNLRNASRGIDERKDGTNDFAGTVQLDRYGNPIAPTKPDTVNRDNWRGKNKDGEAWKSDLFSPSGGKSPGGKGTTEKEVDLLGEIIKKTNDIITLGELKKELTTKTIRDLIDELKLNESLAVSNGQQISYLQTMLSLEEKLLKVLFDKNKFQVRDINTDRNIRDIPNEKPQDFININLGNTLGVYMTETIEAGRRFEDAMYSSLNIVNDLVSLLGLGADNFIAKMLNGLNQVVNLANSIVTLISTLSGSTAGGGFFGFLGGIFKTIFKADGGAVGQGRPYIVGEREPELFVPNSNGWIFNQNQMSQMFGSMQSPPSINSDSYFNVNVDWIKIRKASDSSFYKYKTQMRIA